MSSLIDYAVTLFLSWCALLGLIALLVAGLVWLVDWLGLSVPTVADLDDDLMAVADAVDDWGQWRQEFAAGDQR